MSRRDDLDTLIHSPKRLEIMAVLMGGNSVEFSYLRDELQLAEADCSRQISLLKNAGLLKTRKVLPGGKRTTWVSITPAGRKRYQLHVIALRGILDPHVSSVE